MSAYVWLPSVGSGTSTHGIGSATYYVTTAGSDSTGDGTSGNPWATIDKARSVIRSSGTNVNRDVTVNVGPGNYWSSSTSFAAADSGAGNGMKVTYRGTGAPGTTRLLGGTVLTGWSLVSGSIYKASLASPVWTLWENGRRARAARTPKLSPGASFPAAFAPYYTVAGTSQSDPTLLQYNPADFDPSVWTLADTRLFVWSSPFGTQVAWFTDTHGASALNTTTKVFTLDNAGLKFYSNFGTGGRYTIQGPLQLLTEPGEFVCTGGFVYYWARDGLVPNQEIVVPTTKRVVALVGTDTTTHVSNITFDGISFEYSDFNDWYRFGAVFATQPTGPNDYSYQAQLSIARNGLAYLENTDNVTFTRCKFKNSGFAGVFMREYGQQNVIVSCLFEDIGTTGVYVEGRSPGSGDFIKGNAYSNTIFRRFGQLAGDGIGIRLNQSGNNSIANCDLSVGPRAAITLTGWDDVSPTSGMYCVNNTLSYLNIHSVGQDSGDMGGITYEFMTRIGTQTMNQVIIDGVQAHSSMQDIPPNGMFTDNQTNGQVFSNVWVKNTQGAFMRINDSGGHTATNCSFNADASVNGSFDSTLMDTAHIGVNSGNPYT